MKQVRFVGNALESLRAFPDEARRECGFQLERVQRGFEPNSWKPMSSVGPGVREIRVHDESSAFRVIYVANLAEAVFVLHAFQKKTPRTSKRDIEIARARFKQLKSRGPS
jgi:phage-related protein